MTARPLLSLLLGAAVATALVAGVLGGLARTGVVAPALAQAPWLPDAVLSHAALMMCAFFGTVIAIERAVAARDGAAWLGPLASATGGVLLLLGHDGFARGLFLLAAAALLAVTVMLWRRQRAPHTALLVAASGCWLAGNLMFAARAPGHGVLPWWFAFLVMTIAAERLEMTRLMRRRPAAQPTLLATLVALAIGAAASLPWPVAGGVVFGGALLALAAWLFTYDIARRTVRAQGLSRYMAVCLLGGYAWLTAGGVAWIATALGAPWRDAALHALGLGFIFSMIMGHAPVILPAIARIKVAFGPVYYLPLALLHASLLLRLAGGPSSFQWRAQGALLNALAIVLFALVVAGAALWWRRRHGGRALSRRVP